MSAAIFAGALAGTLSACDKSPAAPSTTTPTTTAPALPSIMSLRISGPASIAPFGRGVFSAIATRADGSIGDVTASAGWTSSSFRVLHTTGSPGLFQAEGRGEAVITATAGGISADYDATITQQSARINITLFGPSIEAFLMVGVPPGVFPLAGTLIGETLVFTIAGDTNYGDYSSVYFLDHLSPTESLGIAASAQGTVTGSEIRAAMSGDIEYWPNATAAGKPTVVCRATDHVAVFRRR